MARGTAVWDEMSGGQLSGDKLMKCHLFFFDDLLSERLTFLSFCFIQVLTNPSLGNSQFERALWEPNFQQGLFVIALSARPSSYFDLSVCWVGNSQR